MASLTWWTWVWVNSGSWWWTGRPGVLPFMGSWGVGHDWVTDLIWSHINYYKILIIGFCPIHRTSLLAQTVKCLPTMWETRVWSLGQENPLEKEMAFHSSTLAWKIPWMEEPARLQSMGSQRVGHDWATSLHFCPIAVGPCVYLLYYMVVCIVIFLATRMDLERIRLSGVRQRKKNIVWYPLYVESKKLTYTKQKQIHRHRK